ncbi:hypothetical protein B0F90DRAFT_1745136 [Multifurca ochricompacta]|uniref:Uncharacterized protein n=1 Tax=Multifurca ochricompacta TaxID=376703 RepID=A0AAD4M1Y3_9AGAM|nr:hypothetical protein B0F90DRAFT_1753762 [Multifurca ochricompacta]KAI0296772.1 hypothetical protein B0F90DRAFT_1745136 [Multifurca ochricompacta]
MRIFHCPLHHFWGEEPNVRAHIQGKSTLANIYTGAALERNFVVNLSYHLPKMIEEASLQILAYCDSYTGINGSSLSDYKDFSIENARQVLNTVALIIVKEGALELAYGDPHH